MTSAAKFVERFRAAWARRDPDALGALFAPGSRAAQPPVPHPFRGEDIPAYFGQVFAAAPDLRLETLAWAARENVVFIEWEITATIADSPLRWRGVDRFRLEGDLAVDEETYFDTLRLWEVMDPTMKRGAMVVVDPIDVRTS